MMLSHVTSASKRRKHFLVRFLDQRMAHYERLTEEDKAKLRLRRAFFLAPV
jgi:hypothetical protein